MLGSGFLTKSNENSSSNHKPTTPSSSFLNSINHLFQQEQEEEEPQQQERTTTHHQPAGARNIITDSPNKQGLVGPALSLRLGVLLTIFGFSTSTTTKKSRCASTRQWQITTCKKSLKKNRSQQQSSHKYTY